MPQLEEALTIKEAAERLRVSPDTVRRRIRRGELKAFKQQGPYGGGGCQQARLPVLTAN